MSMGSDETAAALDALSAKTTVEGAAGIVLLVDYKREKRHGGARLGRRSRRL